MGIIKWETISEFKKSTPTQSGYCLIAEGSGDENDTDIGHFLSIAWYNAQSLRFEHRSGGEYYVLDPDNSYVIRVPLGEGIKKFYHNPMELSSGAPFLFKKEN